MNILYRIKIMYIIKCFTYYNFKLVSDRTSIQLEYIGHSFKVYTKNINIFITLQYIIPYVKTQFRLTLHKFMLQISCLLFCIGILWMI